jgi:hypothetical protein
VKIAYIVWSLVTGISLLGVRTFGNPFSDRVSYRVEYTGKTGSTLWGSYTITQHSRSRESVTEKAIGKLPLTIDFTTSKNMMVSATGSLENQQPIKIKIYKHGVECSASDQTDRVEVSDTIVCR